MEHAPKAFRHPAVNAVVEGPVDDAVARAVCRHLGIGIAGIYGDYRGKDHIRRRMPAYNAAARQARWLVLVDFDGEAGCPPAMVARWLPARSAGMCFRVAVHQAEAWLLADRAGMARFLNVSEAVLPRDPERMPDAKAALIHVARRSRSRTIRQDMVPMAGGTAKVGPGYAARLVEFAEHRWGVGAAAESASSLARCLAALVRF